LLPGLVIVVFLTLTAQWCIWLRPRQLLAMLALVTRHLAVCRAVQRLHGSLSQLLRNAAAPTPALEVPAYSLELTSW
jgi:hypothetical protein